MTKKTNKVEETTQKIQVVELVRRQGIYTTTLQISDPKEVETILSNYDTEYVVAKEGKKGVMNVEFEAKGGRSGKRSYLLRLPDITEDQLTQIGFEKEKKTGLLVKS